MAERSHLDKLTDEFHDLWGRIIEIQQELYDREIAARRHARACGRALREIERVTQPMMRIEPPRLDVVPSVPTKDGGRR